MIEGVAQAEAPSNRDAWALAATIAAPGMAGHGPV
jgi:hypothetical protein